MLEVRGQTRFGQYVSIPPAEEVRIEGQCVSVGRTFINVAPDHDGWLIDGLRVCEIDVIGMLELTCEDEDGKHLTLGPCRFVHLHGPVLVSDLAHVAEFSDADQAWHLDGYGKACGALVLRPHSAIDSVPERERPCADPRCQVIR